MMPEAWVPVAPVTLLNSQRASWGNLGLEVVRLINLEDAFGFPGSRRKLLRTGLHS